MKSKGSILMKLVILQYLAVLCFSQDFDFFYFVQQWPGSYCDTQRSCCYPTTGKPSADFGIHGLWPNYKDGSYPSNCDPNNPFQPSQISDLISSLRRNWPTLACPSGNGIQFWTHEWEKHGTCSESILRSQHDYFESALNLKQRANLLQALTSAVMYFDWFETLLETSKRTCDLRIQPDGGSYSLSSINSAIKGAIGYTPFIQCNVDSTSNSQLYQVYLCVNTNGSDFIECPVFPSGRCASEIEFPSF